jgi:hypothetical protein
MAAWRRHPAQLVKVLVEGRVKELDASGMAMSSSRLTEARERGSPEQTRVVLQAVVERTFPFAAAPPRALGHGRCHRPAVDGSAEVLEPTRREDRFAHRAPSASRGAGCQQFCDSTAEARRVAAGERGFPDPLWSRAGLRHEYQPLEMFMWKCAVTRVFKRAEVREGATQRRVLLVGGSIRAERSRGAYRVCTSKATLHGGPSPQAARFRVLDHVVHAMPVCALNEANCRSRACLALLHVVRVRRSSGACARFPCARCAEP